MRFSCRALGRIIASLAAAMLLGTVAHAGTISLVVTDTSGKPVPDAVVSVMPQTHVAAADLAGRWATPKAPIIDQRNETFIPYVVAVRRGGTVVFRNSDQTRHQVYSFASIKQFQFIVNPGESSEAVQFDVAGVAAIGCNIHDQMIAYIYVTDAPWSAITGSDGVAKIDGLPQGDFVVTVWHPRLKPGATAPTRAVTLPTRQATFTMTAAVLPARIISTDDMY